MSTSTSTLINTSLLSGLTGNFIHGVILFEWVILFKKMIVMPSIGNYIHKVNVIKGSLYSRVYGTKDGKEVQDELCGRWQAL